LQFDANELTIETVLQALTVEIVPPGLTTDAAKLDWLAAIQNNALLDLHAKELATRRNGHPHTEVQSLQEALRESTIDPALLADPGESVSLPPELLEWALQQRNEEETAAGLREIRLTGGLQLHDFLEELEQEAMPRE